MLLSAKNLEAKCSCRCIGVPNSMGSSISGNGNFRITEITIIKPVSRANTSGGKMNYHEISARHDNIIYRMLFMTMINVEFDFGKEEEYFWGTRVGLS